MSNNNDEYTWTDNPTVSGVSPCNTDVLNECLMHLKYDNEGKGSGLNLFDVVEKDHILSLEESKGFAPLGSFVYKEPASSSRYGYPDFYAKCLEEKADGLEVELQLEENTITVYKNMNGHIFYDIADKDAVDLYYLHKGACWMYGIDTENERIFLPRNDWFTQNGASADVGKFVEAGLPNIEGNFVCINQGRVTNPTIDGAFTATQTATAVSSGGAGGIENSINFNASNSSSIYSKSDTVQPAAVKKLMYMVVGNTEVTEAQTTVTEITTSENDTIPLFTAQYFDFTPNNPSWLAAGTQKNSGGIYTTCYNTLVACLTNNIYNIKVVDTTAMTTGVDYSEYWKVDQTAMTFTTPTKSGLRPMGETASVVGNGMTLGLTNGVSNTGLTAEATSTTGVRLSSQVNAYGVPISTSGLTTAEGRLENDSRVGVTTDPEKSGLIAQNTSTAQLYFKVSNAVENLELLDAGEVLTAVANKVDMTNTQWATKALMPDWSTAVSLAQSQYIGATYTFPYRGMLFVSCASHSNSICSINGYNFSMYYTTGTSSYLTCFPGEKDTTFRISNVYHVGNAYFVKFKGDD